MEYLWYWFKTKKSTNDICATWKIKSFNPSMVQAHGLTDMQKTQFFKLESCI